MSEEDVWANPIVVQVGGLEPGDLEALIGMMLCGEEEEDDDS
jgi:hypothetical protein